MKAKRILDLVMSCVLPALMAYELIGETTHEVLGATMLLLVIAHHFLNRSWHTHLTRGRYTPLRVAYAAMDLLLLVLLAAQGVSGIMMAKHTFRFLPHVGRRSSARIVHLMGAYWSFVLMCIHAGMHIAPLARRLGERMKRFPKAARCGVRAAFAVALIYGAAAFVRRRLPLYMLRISEFAFFDFEEPLVFFFCDYLLIMLLAAAVGIAIVRLLSRMKQDKLSLKPEERNETHD